MVQTYDAANPGVETLQLDGFLNGSVTAPVTDDSAPAADDAPAAEPTIEPEADASGAEAPPPEEPADTSDATVDDAAVQAWLKTDAGKAWKRSLRHEVTESVAERLGRALADPSVEKSLGAQERKAFRQIKARSTPAHTDVPVYDDSQYLPWYQKHAEHQAIRADRYAWADHIATHPEDEQIWADMVSKKTREYGLPADATSDQIRTHLNSLNTKLVHQRLQAVTVGLDPNATFDEFMERPEWALLTTDEQNALLPDNFEGDPAKIVRAMERTYGETAATAKARKARQDAVRKAAGVNGKAAAAQAAVDGGLAPPVANGSVVPSVDFAVLRKQWIDAQEAGYVPPDLDAAYNSAVRARKGGSVSFLDQL